MPWVKVYRGSRGGSGRYEFAEAPEAVLDDVDAAWDALFIGEDAFQTRRAATVDWDLDGDLDVLVPVLVTSICPKPSEGSELEYSLCQNFAPGTPHGWTFQGLRNDAGAFNATDEHPLAASRAGLVLPPSNVGGDMVFADVTGDGRVDMVVATFGHEGSASGDVWLYPGEFDAGAGMVAFRFGEPFLPSLSATAPMINAPVTALAVGDLTGDGLPDVVVQVEATTGAPAASFAVLEALQGIDTEIAEFALLPGGSTTTILEQVVGRATSLTIVDVDGDGLNDLVAPLSSSEEAALGSLCMSAPLSVFRNAGAVTDGVLLSVQTLAELCTNCGGQTPEWLLPKVSTGDVDGDGDVDLLVTDLHGDVFVLRHNSTDPDSGKVEFSLAPASENPFFHLTMGSRPGVAVADVTGDGVADVVVAGAHGDDPAAPSSALRLFEGQGDGGITAVPGALNPFVSAVIGARMVIATDWNDDGSEDLLTDTGIYVSAEGGFVQAHNASTTFLHALRSPLFATLQDINGDGKPDMVGAEGGQAAGNMSLVAVLDDRVDAGVDSTPLWRRVDLALKLKSSRLSLRQCCESVFPDSCSGAAADSSRVVDINLVGIAPLQPTASGQGNSMFIAAAKLVSPHIALFVMQVEFRTGPSRLELVSCDTAPFDDVNAEEVLHGNTLGLSCGAGRIVGSGRVHCIAALDSGRLLLLRNPGPGPVRFVPRVDDVVDIAFGMAGFGHLSYVGDLDGDGRLDAVGSNGLAIGWAEQDAGGRFVAQPSGSAEHPFRNAEQLVGGTWAEAACYSTLLLWNAATSIQVYLHDISGDGALDAIVSLCGVTTAFVSDGGHELLSPESGDRFPFSWSLLVDDEVVAMAGVDTGSWSSYAAEYSAAWVMDEGSEELCDAVPGLPDGCEEAEGPINFGLSFADVTGDGAADIVHGSAPIFPGEVATEGGVLVRRSLGGPRSLFVGVPADEAGNVGVGWLVRFSGRLLWPAIVDIDGDGDFDVVTAESANSPTNPTGTLSLSRNTQADCLHGCLGRGVCGSSSELTSIIGVALDTTADAAVGRCLCVGGFTGDACDQCGDGVFGTLCDQQCPSSNSQPCSGHGTCDDGVLGTGECACFDDWEGDVCDVGGCQPGFQPSQGGATQDACVPCSRGFFKAEKSLAECAPCLPGTFANVTGMTECHTAPVGKYQPDLGSADAVACPAGSASSVLGATNCSICEPGTYAGEPGMAQCLQCPVGRATTCKGTAECDACAPGTFSDDKGLVHCKNCPAGRFVKLGGRTECKAAPVGRYTAFDGMDGATPCEPGSFNALEGQVACGACELGKFASGGGATECEPSPVGWFVASKGASAPLPCPAGQFANATESTGCRACAAGRFNNETGQDRCTPAPAGRFAQLQGQSLAVDCPAGSFSAQEGADRCDECPAGRVALLPGQSECTAPQPGYVAALTGQSAAQVCQEGSYSADGIQCVDADVGHFVNGTGQWRQQPCTPGKFSSHRGQQACDDCPAGRFAAAAAATGCEDCPARFDSAPGAAACTPCVRGEVQPSLLSACTACEPQGYSWDPGETLAPATCNACPVGAVCNGGDHVVAQAGYWRDSGDSLVFTACRDAGACLGATRVDNMSVAEASGGVVFESVTKGAVFVEQCADGYTGTLCYQCTSEPLYHRTSFGGCVRCPEASLAIIVVVVVVLIGVVLFVIMQTFQSTKERLQRMEDKERRARRDQASPIPLKLGRRTKKLNRRLSSMQVIERLGDDDPDFVRCSKRRLRGCPRAIAAVAATIETLADTSSHSLPLHCVAGGGLGAWLPQRLLASFVVLTLHRAAPLAPLQLKIILSHLQLVSLTGNIQFHWPQAVEDLFATQAAGSGLSDNVMPLDCVLSSVGGGTLVYLKTALIELGPIFLAVMYGIVWFIFVPICRRKHLRTRRRARERLKAAGHTTLMRVASATKSSNRIVPRVVVEENKAAEGETTVQAWKSPTPSPNAAASLSRIVNAAERDAEAVQQQPGTGRRTQLPPIRRKDDSSTSDDALRELGVRNVETDESPVGASGDLERQGSGDSTQQLLDDMVRAARDGAAEGTDGTARDGGASPELPADATVRSPKQTKVASPDANASTLSMGAVAVAAHGTLRREKLPELSISPTSGMKHLLDIFSPWRGFAVSFICSFFVLQSSLLRFSFSILSCTQLTMGPEPAQVRSVLLSDMDVFCDSAEHKRYQLLLGALPVFVYGLVLPAFALGFLIWNRKQLNDIRFVASWGFLFMSCTWHCAAHRALRRFPPPDTCSMARVCGQTSTARSTGRRWC